AAPDLPHRRRGRSRSCAGNAFARLTAGARFVRKRGRRHGEGRKLPGRDRRNRLNRAACPQRFADQALKSSSETLGNFLRKATIVQISWSGTSARPKLG